MQCEIHHPESDVNEDTTVVMQLPEKLLGDKNPTLNASDSKMN